MNDDESFDLAAAGLRADGDELTGSLELLAGRLAGALPAHTQVRRRGGMLGMGAKRVREIRVQLGSSLYELRAGDGGVEAFRERHVGGISIKREPLSPEEWVLALTAELRSAADRSAEAREALQRLLG